MTGWDGIAWAGWSDHAEVLARLGAGADPEWCGAGRPLHHAAAYGSPQVVAELAARVADVDAREHGTTALWRAVLADRPDNARVLAAAGADPWRPQLGGWSPGRLALAGPVPDLFPRPAGGGAATGATTAEPVATELTPTERETVRSGRELVAALGEFPYEGTGLACVAGIDAAEAVRRLGGQPLDAEYLEEFLDDPYAYEMEEGLLIAGATTVPGGCVVTQPWGYTPSTPGAMARLTAGTFGYGLYANPKSGNQGSIVRDGTVEAWDLHPGGGPDSGDSADRVLDGYLYRRSAVAAACAFAGLRPADARAVTGPADRWFKLPDLDYWEG
ncbi:ankyrin repeat domain-containing protein [Kitasatospora sp. NA04385]|uniref:ankyrin repeat domain-containing protein n=1 Tax=Kitasatospora sp. NA04385 TaxID=2742135 RepID=UPI00158FD66C|nr:ankyrin repeat domain-containing protein [Kitasatospora sp. NA04385]QKW23319.1 ankyrin repeat domain-containing protein [Kitasatospora sp. NA04385]